MNRRQALRWLTVTPLALGTISLRTAAQTSSDIETMQQDWLNYLPEGFTPPDPADQLQQDADAWRQQLSEQAFQVLRKEGTERPFTSALNDEKRRGLFLCAGCDLPLFTSQMKYESGTGWPSFFTAIPGALDTKRDFKMFLPRTEYHCTRCGGHQGHVFKDGPPPTNQRWCNNGVALRFLPSDTA